MDVVSSSPLRVASVVWQPRADAFVLTFVCKATFTLTPGESPLAPDQDDPTEADVYWDGDERRSLRAPSDLAPFKRRADVLLVGHAYAPNKQPAASVVARLTVEELQKSIEVFGDRAFSEVGKHVERGLFLKVPLRWERAAGGPGTLNPVGVPPNAPRDMRGLSAIPNLQPVGLHVTRAADVIPPVGFGPIAPTWPLRSAVLGRHAAGFSARAWSQKPLPEDLDAAYFNAALPDQQVDVLRGNERIVLENLHPDHALLMTRLAAVTPRATVQRPGSSEQEVRLRCDTLLIDTDRGVCSLVWRGAVPLQSRREWGRILVTAEGIPATQTDNGMDSTVILRGGSGAEGGAARVLPFIQRAPGAAPVPASVPAPVPAPVSASGSAAEDSDIEPEPATRPGPRMGGADTLTLSMNPAGDALPFVRPAAGTDAGAGARTDANTSAGADAVTDEVTAELRVPAAAAAPAAVAAKASVAGSTLNPVPAAEPAPVAASEPEELPPWLPPKPPMMGPLVSAPEPEKKDGGLLSLGRFPSMVELLRGTKVEHPEALKLAALTDASVKAAAPAESSPRAEPAPALAPAPAPAPKTEAAAQPDPEIDPEEFTIEQFASISAEIAEKRAPRSDVLKAHGLTARSWARLEMYFTDELEKEADLGSSALRNRSDKAYVATVESFRGPITLADYARIVVSLERGQSNEALDELKIQRPALMPILRVWTKKAAGDRRLAGETTATLAAVRSKMRQLP